MDTAIFIVVLFFYSLFKYGIKKILSPEEPKISKSSSFNRKKGYEWAFFISPDFWWANYFKNRIKQFNDDASINSLKEYVIINNKANLILSILITGLVFFAFTFDPESQIYKTLISAAVIRSISRSFEISLAFGRDVLQVSQNATGLKKFERIKLAISSYFEIFIYFAAVYLVLPCGKGISYAITSSLSVGTLTNVGFVFVSDHFVNNIAFVQVFTTLSLVVLSLASYLSRGDNYPSNNAL